MAGKLPPPVLLAMVPAEHVHFDSIAKYTVLNILNYVPIRSFPSPPVKIGIFVCVTAVRQSTRLEVDLVTPDGTSLSVFTWDLVPTLPIDPLEVYQSGGNAGVVYAVPGNYFFKATADGQPLGEWRILVDSPGTTR
jgi:alanine-alpha-ketoisovalerate/valine-pyruvate aminotransferase